MNQTTEQAKFLEILEAPHYLTQNQALKLFQGISPGKTSYHFEHMISQLKFAGGLFQKDGFVFERGLAMQARAVVPNQFMIQAIDIMLDLSNGVLSGCAAHKKPYLLKFLCGSDPLESYGIIYVEPGKELEIVFALEKEPFAPEHTVIFMLNRLEQREKLTTNFRHYFTLPEDGKIRYFRGIVPEKTK